MRQAGFGTFRAWLAANPQVLWLALILLLLLALILVRRRRIDRAGKHAARLIPQLGLDCLHDVMIPDGVGGQIHLDYLLLTARGLWVIDVRDYRGTIFGAEGVDGWTQLIGRRSYRFENPLYLNQARVFAVRALASEVPVDGTVAFTRDGQFPKGMPRNVCYLHALPTRHTPVDKAALEGLPIALRLAWQKIRQAVARPQ